MMDWQQYFRYGKRNEENYLFWIYNSRASEVNRPIPSHCMCSNKSRLLALATNKKGRKIKAYCLSLLGDDVAAMYQSEFSQIPGVWRTWNTSNSIMEEFLEVCRGCRRTSFETVYTGSYRHQWKLRSNKYTLGHSDRTSQQSKTSEET